jgi:hypothetical protein
MYRNQSELSGMYALCRRMRTMIRVEYAIPANPHTPREKLRLAVVCPGVVRIAATRSTAQKCRTVGEAKAAIPPLSVAPLVSAVNVITTNIKPVSAAADKPMIM